MRALQYFRILLFVGAVHGPLGVAAQNPASMPPSIDPVMVRAGFLEAHPDLRYRILGLEKYKSGDMDDAVKFFRRAAFYADKPSQGMLAEMYWSGKGLQKDPVQGYIWMDLAAERGYVGFLGMRERYWASLDDAQRKQAITEGQATYAEYGDDVAQSRMAIVLRRERLRMTGSRTGSTGNLKVLVPGPADSMEQIDGSKFFDERYWNPVKYQQWQDSVWKEPRIGMVRVGTPDTVRDVSPKSRVPEMQVDANPGESVVPIESETPAVESKRD